MILRNFFSILQKFRPKFNHNGWNLIASGNSAFSFNYQKTASEESNFPVLCNKGQKDDAEVELVVMARLSDA
jgi:hypothetical protein